MFLDCDGYLNQFEQTIVSCISFGIGFWTHSIKTLKLLANEAFWFPSPRERRSCSYVKLLERSLHTKQNNKWSMYYSKIVPMQFIASRYGGSVSNPRFHYKKLFTPFSMVFCFKTFLMNFSMVLLKPIDCSKLLKLLTLCVKQSLCTLCWLYIWLKH